MQPDPANPLPALPLFRGDPHPCPYLPGRVATDLWLIDPGIDAAAYQSLMNLGFRRSGRVFYRPQCDGCRECVPIRVPVADFQPSRSQRRAARKNADLSVEIGRPRLDDERYAVYAAFQQVRHGGGMGTDRNDLARFLYDSPIATLEFTYRLGPRLIGVGIVDQCPDCLSSVYFYFDPEFERRSPGVFSALCEIEHCRRLGLPFWYIGLYVRDCREMNYKAQYRPHELLGPDGRWHRPVA